MQTKSAHIISLFDGEMKPIAAAGCALIPPRRFALSPVRLFSPYWHRRTLCVCDSLLQDSALLLWNIILPSVIKVEPANSSTPSLLPPSLPVEIAVSQCGWDNQVPAALMSRQHSKDLPSDLATHAFYIKPWGKNPALPPLARWGLLSQYFQEDIATNRHEAGSWIRHGVICQSGLCCIVLRGLFLLFCFFFQSMWMDLSSK